MIPSHNDVWMEIDDQHTYIVAESHPARELLGEFRIMIDQEKIHEWQAYLEGRGMRVARMHGRIPYVRDVPAFVTDIPLYGGNHE